MNLDTLKILGRFCLVLGVIALISWKFALTVIGMVFGLFVVIGGAFLMIHIMWNVTCWVLCEEGQMTTLKKSWEIVMGDSKWK